MYLLVALTNAFLSTGLWKYPARANDVFVLLHKEVSRVGGDTIGVTTDRGCDKHRLQHPRLPE